MYIYNSDTSNQIAQHRRRVEADNKKQADRLAETAGARETTAREGAERKAGEAPAREEIAKFRSLMQAPGKGREEPKSDPAKLSANTQPGASETPKFDGELATLSTAERFRTLMQRAFASGAEQKDPAAAHEQSSAAQREAQSQTNRPETTASDSARASAQSERLADARQAPDARRPADLRQTPDSQRSVDPRQGDDAQRSAATQERQPARGTETPIPLQEGGKSLAETSKSRSGEADQTERKPGGERKQATTSAGADVESAQEVARKAADGQTEAGPAARRARSADESKEGEGGDAGAAQTNAGGTPTPMSADLAPPPMQPQQMADAPQRAAASGNVAPALSELMQKHVRQMLVTDPRSSRGRSREVLLRMQNDVLPGTDLWLTQTDDGWQLRADVRSRDAYDTLLANQDELVQRFADSALGKLSIEPVFHG